MTLRRLSDGTVVDSSDIGPDGLLRDGGRLRVPQLFRDHNRRLRDNDDDDVYHRRSVTVRDPIGREMCTITHDGSTPAAPIGSRPMSITSDALEAARRESHPIAVTIDAMSRPTPTRRRRSRQLAHQASI
jgi:hypothetical protein